ncbi:MAG: siderophore-interacting protein [Hydrocarboniphaga sp.]|uniref:siderophore-interacting protein n=1 Tax=Hydrocarboniphaga sp. TaxID=2033016 RepID=UPI00263737FE|nr:siderophore-interacting protein [Hydrocarboniphaga sp.]MDB5970505.1 siderophore-interacting protein [Hydrocarboniphaga sp.]
MIALPEAHVFTRVRHRLVPRQLQVRRVVDLTPKMRRITLSGADLAGFTSPSPDDHVKLFFPLPGEDRPRMPDFSGEPMSLPEGTAAKTMISPARDYTPRRYDPRSGELDIEFVLHGEGPAAIWAAQAKAGQWIGVGGPRGSTIAPNDFDSYVLAGDETALPSIARRLEELPAKANVIVVAEVANADEQQPLPVNTIVYWLHRNGAAPGDLLERAMRTLELPDGDCYVWLACESRRAMVIRDHLTEQRGHPPEWVKAVGYWKE